MDDYEPKSTFGVFSFIALYLLVLFIAIFFSYVATGLPNTGLAVFIALVVVFGLEFGRRNKYNKWKESSKRNKQR